MALPSFMRGLTLRDKGTYTDSAHHLLRLRAGRQKRSYTLVVSRHGPACDAAFTLTAHGHAPLQLHELPRAYPHETRVSSSAEEELRHV